MNRLVKLFVAAIAVVLLGAACSSGGPAPEKSGETQPSATAGSVAVALSEFAMTPSVRAVSAGSVTFSVSNTGSVEHEFVILRTSAAADALPQKGAEASEAGLVDEIEGIKSGEAGSLNVDLASGHYVVICNLPDHYAAGMYADLTVN